MVGCILHRENGENSHVKTIKGVPDLRNCRCQGKQIIGISSIREIATKNLRTAGQCERTGIVGDVHPRRKEMGWRCSDSEVYFRLESPSLRRSMIYMIYVPNDTERLTLRVIPEGASLLHSLASPDNRGFSVCWLFDSYSATTGNLIRFGTFGVRDGPGRAEVVRFWLLLVRRITQAHPVPCVVPFALLLMPTFSQCIKSYSEFPIPTLHIF